MPDVNNKRDMNSRAVILKGLATMVGTCLDLEGVAMSMGEMGTRKTIANIRSTIARSGLSVMSVWNKEGRKVSSDKDASKALDIAEKEMTVRKRRKAIESITDDTVNLDEDDWAKLDSILREEENNG